MKNEEHEIQSCVIEIWSFLSKQFGVDESLLFAIPNGGRRDKATGAYLKKEGVRAGVPDLFLACPRGSFAGLFIEMKTESGILSESQKRMRERLSAQGYLCAVCRSVDQTINIITDYLKNSSMNTMNKNEAISKSMTPAINPATAQPTSAKK